MNTSHTEYCYECNLLIHFEDIYIYENCGHKFHIECVNIEFIIANDLNCIHCELKLMQIEKLKKVIISNKLKNAFNKIKIPYNNRKLSEQAFDNICFN